MSIPSKAFYYIRHGQTDWNKQRIAMGQQDVPLNERGIQQAAQAISRLHNVSISHIVSSPLQRARQTANIISNNLKTPITFIDHLKEAHWGELEGKKKEENWFEYWRMGGTIKDAEPYAHFVKRVMHGLQEALTLKGTTLIVSHGGVYWAIQEALQLEVFDLPNCLPVYHSPPAVEGHNWAVSSTITPEKTCKNISI